MGGEEYGVEHEKAMDGDVDGKSEVGVVPALENVEALKR